mgnify:CR=1 FL=1
MDNIKKEILEALESKNGIVSEACKSIGLARSTFYKWCADDKDFKAAVDEIQDVALDYVESKLFEKIEGIKVKKGETDNGQDIVYDLPPSDTAIIFYLKTKGKKRGYVERSEFTGKDGEPLNSAPPVTKLPDGTTLEI